jgi:hypothetical protein
MSKLRELRRNYTDEEIIDMVECGYECVYDEHELSRKLHKSDKGDTFLMVPRFFIYNLRNYLIKIEKENKLSDTLSGEVVSFINSQESGTNKNRGAYIASNTDIKNWINYLKIYNKY